jgi:hypothetical protein
MPLDIDLFGEHWVTRRPLHVEHGRGGLCHYLPTAALPPSGGAGRPRTVPHAVLGFARRGMSSTLTFPLSIRILAGHPVRRIPALRSIGPAPPPAPSHLKVNRY